MPSIITTIPLFLLNYRLLLTLQTRSTLSPSSILSAPIIYTCLLVANEFNIWGSNRAYLWCAMLIPYLNISLGEEIEGEFTNKSSNHENVGHYRSIFSAVSNECH